MRKEDRHLEKRGKRWFYNRRVPVLFRALDDRRVIRTALKTDSIEVARFRRDAMEAADDDYWASLLGVDNEDLSSTNCQRLRDTLTRRYRAANARALARGFVYTPVEELIEKSDLQDIYDRIQVIKTFDQGKASQVERVEADALLGVVPEPPVTVSEAFDIYCNEIAVGDLLNKSPKQKQLWFKTKNRAVAYFIDVVGDLVMKDIKRPDALKYYNWWAGRLIPKVGAKPLKANTANRDLGNMRKLYTEYFRHIGQEDQQNPFRNLAFKDMAPTEVPPFEDEWVRSKILVPGIFDRLNDQAVAIIYTLIETGCRPSEIANLMPDDIILDTDVPYIRIRPREGMEIKTVSSIRDIPLVGVSLEAMKTAPEGFPRYRDKNDLLSQSLMKAFRSRDLFPTDKHVIYSFRHSFEKRMLEAGLDYGFRCMMMGHRHNRPKYGDGGSMEYRRDQLLKIAHPLM